jgi:hypothetical protein
MALLDMKPQSRRPVQAPASSYAEGLDQAKQAVAAAVEQGWMAVMAYETHVGGYLGETRMFLQDAAKLIERFPGLGLGDVAATAERAAEAAAEAKANGGAR